MNALKIIFASVCLIAAFNAQTANAQVIFPDRTSFDSAYPGATVDNWSEYPKNTVINSGSTENGIMFLTNGYSIRDSQNLISSSFPNSLGSNKVGDLGFFTKKDEISFNFSQSLTAFAIDINSTALKGGAFEAILSNGEILTSVKDPTKGDPLEQFIGFSDTTSSFDSITIKDLTSNPYKINELDYVDPPQSVVPEPNTIALMVIGLMGIAIFTIRRKMMTLK